MPYERNFKMKCSYKNRSKGFTLIEILAVVLIVTMLATLVVPNVLKKFGKAKLNIARTNIAIIESALNEFYMDCGRLPTQSEGLTALVKAPADLEEWDGVYCKEKVLIDPWGRPFEYHAEGAINPGSYDIISYGADGNPGGDGENSDITNE